MSTSGRKQFSTMTKSDAITSNSAVTLTASTKTPTVSGVKSKEDVPKTKPEPIFDDDSGGEEDWQWVFAPKPESGADSKKSKAEKMATISVSDQRAKRLAERQQRGKKRSLEEEEDGSTPAPMPKRARTGKNTESRPSTSTEGVVSDG
ncbi:hypothetical protein LTS18_007074 [Coniosporium uncinatum]|uniref:Uncharacterized protein n=1 Tax=Coniosporium uncinatum TaxID=93489 RepID=A0ACC3DX75_9PEZI|nr:hypothetical protein LTS18_007074 [Coniosporium uncinatum]